MRHLLIALFIALLPLRAWVGDAMAITMQTSSPIHEVAPCPDHAMDQSTDTADHQHGICDVCNGPAMALTAPPELLASSTHGVLTTPTERFVSSVPPQGSKPPIS